ncbi:MAG TPA: DNA translocase FtsK 4TM domain-containing protein, partial [Longimicrobiaceae bacterium]|nr:DNA translocase FtsK 4TM domain-containing protein [Longimicrobiaceae bacterium]
MSLSLDDRQRRELWGLALLALALLLALSLIPVALLGAAALRVFATGNVVGVIGAWLNGAAWGFLGVGGFAVPVLLALWGLVAFGKLDAAPVVRWTLLLSGLAILVPAAVGVSSSDDGISLSAGWLGTAIGGLLTGLLSPVGAGLVLFFLFAGLCVVTLRWNPLRTMVRGTRAAGRGAQGIVTAMPAIADKLPRPSMPTFTKRTADDSGDEEPDRDYEGGYDGEYGGRAAAFRDEDEDDPFEGDRFEASFPPAAAGRRSAVPASPNGDEATLPFPAPRANGSASPASPPDAVVEAASSAAAAKPAKKAARAASDENADPLPVDTGDPLSGDKPGTMLLDPPPTRDEMRNRAELDKLGQVLIDKLATFKIEGTIVGMTTGPVVTQFEVSPAPGIKVARIASLDADLALAMRAPSIRIVAPIPGKGAVGVEVPNPEPEMVFFREVIESPQFRGSKASLPLALGKDIAGKPHVADLAKMPHLLIAGATGSGKSVCVNTIITSLIYRHSPQTLRFLMVDPKMVELSMYNDLPHLRHPVVTDNSDAAAVLKWAVIEMERRYQLLSANGVRNLSDFNARVDSGQLMRSPDPDGE